MYNPPTQFTNHQLFYSETAAGNQCRTGIGTAFQCQTLDRMRHRRAAPGLTGKAELRIMRRS